MNLESRKHHRRSIRLKDYDYTQPGAYFVTVCTYRWQHLFGEIVDGTMVLNPLGQAVREEWLRTASIRSYVELDEYLIMPNHIHGIIMIHDYPGFVGATRRVAPTTNRLRQPRGPKPDSLGAIIGQFKSRASKCLNNIRGTPGQPVWQRNYYEHIIRDERSLHRIQQYVDNNPQRWHLDRYNPDGVGQDKFEERLKGI